MNAIVRPTPRNTFNVRRLGGVIAGLMLVLAIVGTSLRIVRNYGPPGPFDPNHQGLCDFHNGLYFPAIALLDGVSPYGGDYASRYPVSRSIPFYSPSVLLLHAPLTMLPLRVAEIAFVVLCYFIVIAIGFFLVHVSSLQADQAGWPLVLGIAALVACSRGGHITIYNGYFTLELILATFVAIHYAPHRPWLAAFALAIVAIKPTFILPLGFLLLARGNVRALILGAALTSVFTLGPMTYLAAHAGDANLLAGWRELIDQIIRTQEIHRAVPSESPTLSWTRIDALALVAKWVRTDPPQWVYLTSMIGLNIPAIWILHRRRNAGFDDGLLGVTGLLITTSVLISVYHQFYDALLLVAPIVGLIGFAKWPPLQDWRRVAMVGLLLVPLLNYLTSNAFLSRVPPHQHLIDVITSINAVVLLLTWLITIGHASAPLRLVTAARGDFAAE